MPVDDRNLDNAISRLVVRFGEQAVRASLDRISGKRRGRPKIDDWEVLADLLEQDAHAIVTGGTPTSSRKSIARDFAIQRRGQSEASTIRRIERKLAQNREHYASVPAKPAALDGLARQSPLFPKENVSKSFARRGIMHWTKIPQLHCHKRQSTTNRKYACPYLRDGPKRL